MALNCWPDETFRVLGIHFLTIAFSVELPGRISLISFDSWNFFWRQQTVQLNPRWVGH
jgi:hypothetical protein